MATHGCTCLRAPVLCGSGQQRLALPHLTGARSPCSSSRQAAARLQPCAAARSSSRPAPPLGRSSSRSSSRLRAEPEAQGERPVVYNKEFGYSRKDVLIIIVALIAVGVLMYEGLQAAGMDAGMAGNWVQLTIFLGICVGWVSTYLWRVANKKMTYAQQLQMYEEAVMQKRLEEMTEAEMASMLADVEAERARMQAAKEALEKQQPRTPSP